jgi:D-3-phosphoglycerate dehydrogenase
MHKVLLPERIDREGLALLEGKVELVYTRDPSEDAIIESIKGVTGIVLRSRAKITRRVIESADCLKIISRTGAGYDNVDVEAATERGIMVCNLPGINSVTVAEHTMAVMLALFKKIPDMDGFVRDGQWSKRSLYLPRELYGKTAGIIGLGKIGRIVMNYCRCFGMKVIAYDPYVVQDSGEDYRLAGNLEEIFSEADVVTVHVPNLPETRGIISEKLLESMKRGSFFINTSRGDVVDEKALVKVLEDGILSGAGIDVFVNEPVDADNPLLKFKNVILSPHSAALTLECGIKMTVEAVRQVADFVEGRQPAFIVNRKGLNI